MTDERTVSFDEQLTGDANRPKIRDHSSQHVQLALPQQIRTSAHSSAPAPAAGTTARSRGRQKHGGNMRTAEQLETNFVPSFISVVDADRLFNELQSLPWDQHVISMYGRRIPAPRKFVWMGIPPMPKSYSGGTPNEGAMYGKAFKVTEWTSAAREIQQRVHDVTGVLFNSLNINLYRDEKDHLGFHIDKEDEGLWSFPIASVSLGAERDFQIQRYEHAGVSGRRRKPVGAIETYRLNHGSLIVMPAGHQAEFQHRLKKQTTPCGQRINLTFRMMPEEKSRPVRRPSTIAVEARTVTGGNIWHL